MNYQVLTGSYLGTLILTDFGTGTQTKVADGSGSSGAVNKMVFVNSTTIVAGTVNKQLLFWQISPTYTLLRSFTTTHTGSITAVCSINGAYVVTGSADSKAIVWNLASMTASITFSQHTSTVNDVILLSNGDRVATASSDKTVSFVLFIELNLF